jgi:hypothetical protein
LIFVVLGILAARRSPAEVVQAAQGLSSALKDSLYPPRQP